jgi:hypothetical protein
VIGSRKGPRFRKAGAAGLSGILQFSTRAARRAGFSLLAWPQHAPCRPGRPIGRHLFSPIPTECNPH